jgi:hypothetical protein
MHRLYGARLHIDVSLFIVRGCVWIANKLGKVFKEFGLLRDAIGSIPLSTQYGPPASLSCCCWRTVALAESCSNCLRFDPTRLLGVVTLLLFIFKIRIGGLDTLKAQSIPAPAQAAPPGAGQHDVPWGQGVPGGSTTGWQCARCTFTNEPMSLVCSVCMSLPESAPPPQGGAPPAAAAGAGAHPPSGTPYYSGNPAGTQYAAQHPAVPAAPAATTRPWNCQMCTFENSKVLFVLCRGTSTARG